MNRSDFIKQITLIIIGLLVSMSSPLTNASILHPNYVESKEIKSTPSDIMEIENKEPDRVTIHGNISAYTGGWIMANGEHPHVGAVANDVLPFGTIVRINGLEYVVKDRFGGGYGIERFDIYMDNESACWNFGRQYLTVEIIG